MIHDTYDELAYLGRNELVDPSAPEIIKVPMQPGDVLQSAAKNVWLAPH